VDEEARLWITAGRRSNFARKEPTAQRPSREEERCVRCGNCSSSRPSSWRGCAIEGPRGPTPRRVTGSVAISSAAAPTAWPGGTPTGYDASPPPRPYPAAGAESVVRARAVRPPRAGFRWGGSAGLTVRARAVRRTRRSCRRGRSPGSVAMSGSVVRSPARPAAPDPAVRDPARGRRRKSSGRAGAARRHPPPWSGGGPDEAFRDVPKGGGGRRSGMFFAAGGQADPRITSSVGRTTVIGRSGAPLMRASRCWAMARPMSAIGWRTVVRGGSL
jgi:ferredoxin